MENKPEFGYKTPFVHKKSISFHGMSTIKTKERERNVFGDITNNGLNYKTPSTFSTKMKSSESGLFTSASSSKSIGYYSGPILGSNLLTTFNESEFGYQTPRYTCAVMYNIIYIHGKMC